jgi:hypothetical protein
MRPPRGWAAAVVLAAIVVTSGAFITMSVVLARQTGMERQIRMLAENVEGFPGHAGNPTSPPGWAPPAAAGTGASAEALRRVVREELASGGSVAGSETGAAGVIAEAPPPPSPESIQAFEKAGAVVSGALATGTWREQDVTNLRALGAVLTAEQMDALVRQVAVAVNKGELRLEVTGAPF